VPLMVRRPWFMLRAWCSCTPTCQATRFRPLQGCWRAAAWGRSMMRPLLRSEAEPLAALVACQPTSAGGGACWLQTLIGVWRALQCCLNTRLAHGTWSCLWQPVRGSRGPCQVAVLLLYPAILASQSSPTGIMLGLTSTGPTSHEMFAS